nr:MAG TPA: PORTAL PROTEIN [Caudoviricetes sp.]
MEIEQIKQLIKKHTLQHDEVVSKMEIADRYYLVQNDILRKKNKPKDVEEAKRSGEAYNPMHQADNRIAYSFYPLLVDQKTAYMFTAPPIFDVKDDRLNTIITDTLGDSYEKKCKDLCVKATNGGIAWVHYWIDDEEGFQWAVLPAVEIIPIWNRRINTKLEGVLRVYIDRNEEGESITVYEYWNDKEVQAYSIPNGGNLEVLGEHAVFTMVDPSGVESDVATIPHAMGKVPFIPFANNANQTSDLTRIKSLIDTYDKTYSGFLNDLEDVQEVIYVLTNYGGENLTEFLEGMKKYKAIQMDSTGPDDRSGISTLTIDIPVEARKELLTITRKAIFDMGQGVDPQQQGLDGTSGEAMKFLYTLLELKAGMMETEFQLGFNELVRAICRLHGNDKVTITQTWTRTSVKNDGDLVAMCSQSMGIVSKRTILAHHPFVEDINEELEQLKAEEAETNSGIYDDWNLEKHDHDPIDGHNSDDSEE